MSTSGSWCGRDVAPGVLAYAGDEVAGWAAVAPRSELPFARSAKIPHVDDLPAWSAWCIRVCPGYRGRGISQVLLDGAVAYARSQGAPAIEGYPVDNQGKKVDLTMAFVGTRKLFEDAGFTKAADTSSVAGASACADAAGPVLTAECRCRASGPCCHTCHTCLPSLTHQPAAGPRNRHDVTSLRSGAPRCDIVAVCPGRRVG